MPLRLKLFAKICLVISFGKKIVDVDFALTASSFAIGHKYSNISLMINNLIYVSKLQIIRKKNNSTFRWYALHPLKSCHFFEIFTHGWVAFFLKHPLQSVPEKLRPIYGCCGTAVPSIVPFLYNCIACASTLSMRPLLNETDTRTRQLICGTRELK